MTPLPYIKRLASSEVFIGDDPWSFAFKNPIPPAVFGNKSLRTEWANAQSTDHNFYAGFLGLNKSLRVSAQKSDDTGNPPVELLALIGDYDVPMREELMLDSASALTYPPNWIERTMSGNWRYVWLLEEPIVFPCYAFALHFLKKFKDFAFDPALGGIGLDVGAWENPTRYYTNSGNWQPLNDKPIPAALAKGWFVKAAEKFDKKHRELGPTVPVAELIPALRQKYPKFSEWPGDFEVGKMGPTFWVDGSKSPRSATVWPTGMSTFSAHAGKSFFNWADLLGMAFIKESQALNAAARAEDIWCDSLNYWRKDNDGSWVSLSKERMMTFLRVQRKVSDKRKKDSDVSDLDEVLNHIELHQRVKGAAPFCFKPTGLLLQNRERFLNLGTPPVIAPLTEPVEWGPDGRMPFISEFLGGFFSLDENGESTQLERFLAWLKRFYTCGYTMEPRPGQAVFLVGKQGTGKTFLSTGLLSHMFGGHAEGSATLGGTEMFGSQMFYKNLWTMDDASTSTNWRKHLLFTEKIKANVANQSATFHEKFKVPCQIIWMGRIICTMNGDAQSLAMLPSTDRANQDKLMFFQVADREFVFPEPQEIRDIFERETPAFCRWLLDWDPPAHCGYGEGRFGVIHYAQEGLAESAHQASNASGFREILMAFLKFYFENTEEATEWRGTSVELHSAISGSLASDALLRSYSLQSINQNLATIMGWRSPQLVITDSSENGSRIWTIQRPNLTQST